MKKRKMALLMSIFFLVVASVPIGAEGFWYLINPAEIEVSYRDAYYSDYEGDGNEDDVTIRLTIEIFDSAINTYYGVNFDLYIGLELPSGTEYWYLIEFSYWHTNEFPFSVYLLNHATESGWYKATTIGYIEGKDYYYENVIIFDPPGASKPGDPDFIFNFE